MESVRELIESFAGNPINVRLEVTQRILAIGPRAIPELVQGLSHHSWDVRQDCANALAEFAAPSTVPPLIDALSDPQTGVRYEAARALGKIGSTDAKKALEAAAVEAESDDYRYFLYDAIQGKV